jgi:hypothetical protein
MLHLRARNYFPNLGTFLSLDPFEGTRSRPMSLNGYSYVEGNVPNRTDPSGMTDTVIRNWPGDGGFGGASASGGDVIGALIYAIGYYVINNLPSVDLTGALNNFIGATQALPENWNQDLQRADLQCESYVNAALNILVRHGEEFKVWADGGRHPDLDDNLDNRLTIPLDQVVVQRVQGDSYYHLTYDGAIIGTPQPSTLNVTFGLITWEAAFHVYIEHRGLARDTYHAFYGVNINEFQRKLDIGNSKYRNHFPVYGLSIADIPALASQVYALVVGAKVSPRDNG